MTYNVAIRPELEGQSAFRVLDLIETLEEGEMTINPVVIHTCDGVLDLLNDVENGGIGYTALFVSRGSTPNQGSAESRP